MKTESLDQVIASTILKSDLVEHNIAGAPFSIGDKVRVLCNPNKDETFDDTLVNHTGKVIFLEYNCGCGQTFPYDPMIGVRFRNGRIEEFWKEELRTIG